MVSWSKEDREHVDWLKDAARDVQELVPQLGESALFICRRLAELLVRTLPRSESRRLLQLLPSESRFKVREDRALRALSRTAGRRPRISYRQFQERAMEALALDRDADFSDKSDAEIEAISHQITDHFFNVLGRTLPDRQTERLLEFLPDEVSNRLRSAA